MKKTKDLSWLSVPAFFLIIGMLALYAIKQNAPAHHSERLKSEISILQAQKPA